MLNRTLASRGLFLGCTLVSVLLMEARPFAWCPAPAAACAGGLQTACTASCGQYDYFWSVCQTPPPAAPQDVACLFYRPVGCAPINPGPFIDACRSFGGTPYWLGAYSLRCGFC